MEIHDEIDILATDMFNLANQRRLCCVIFKCKLGHTPRYRLTASIEDKFQSPSLTYFQMNKIVLCIYQTLNHT